MPDSPPPPLAMGADLRLTAHEARKSRPQWVEQHERSSRVEALADALDALHAVPGLQDATDSLARAAEQGFVLAYGDREDPVDALYQDISTVLTALGMVYRTGVTE